MLTPYNVLTAAFHTTVPERAISPRLICPMIATTRQLTVTEPPTRSNTCSGDGYFTITANSAPQLNDCFKGTGEPPDGVSAAYTVSGVVDTPEVTVFSLEDSDGNVSAEAVDDVQQTHLHGVHI